MLDPQNNESSIDEQLTVLLHELKTYDPSLLEKSIWIALNKKDTLSEDLIAELKTKLDKTLQLLSLHPKGIATISGFTGDNTNQFLGMIAQEMTGGEED